MDFLRTGWSTAAVIGLCVRKRSRRDRAASTMEIGRTRRPGGWARGPFRRGGRHPCDL